MSTKRRICKLSDSQYKKCLSSDLWGNHYWYSHTFSLSEIDHFSYRTLYAINITTSRVLWLKDSVIFNSANLFTPPNQLLHSSWVSAVRWRTPCTSGSTQILSFEEDLWAYPLFYPPFLAEVRLHQSLTNHVIFYANTPHNQPLLAMRRMNL